MMKNSIQKIAGWMGVLGLVFTGVQCTEQASFPTVPLPELQAEAVPVVDAEMKSVTSADGKVSWDAADELKAYIVPSDASGVISWQDYEARYKTDAQNCAKGIFFPGSRHLDCA